MIRTEVIGSTLCVRIVKAQVLVSLQEDKENVVDARAPAIGPLRVADFVLDITIQQRGSGICAAVYPGSCQVFSRRVATGRVMVLCVVVVEARTIHITKIALNQGIIVALNTSCWLPENSIDVRCSIHHRTTVVTEIASEGLRISFLVEMGCVKFGRCKDAQGGHCYNCQHQHRYREDWHD